MSEYSAIPSSGKLKLKGVKDSRIDKKKKKKKPKADDEPSSGGDFVDKSVVLKTLEDEDSKIEKESHEEAAMTDRKEASSSTITEKNDLKEHLKTDAEKRYDEQRRKRLEERLKREGVKTHKERVEELNRYLSNLSEHHDMPKIGPG